jgi:hypothetical protein
LSALPGLSFVKDDRVSSICPKPTEESAKLVGLIPTAATKDLSIAELPTVF